jgi:hypothetical protein
MWSAVN